MPSGVRIPPPAPSSVAKSFMDLAMEDCLWREATELLQLRGIRTAGAMFAHSGKPRGGVDCKMQGILTDDSKSLPQHHTSTNINPARNLCNQVAQI